jgi:hypothetical protein
MLHLSHIFFWVFRKHSIAIVFVEQRGNQVTLVPQKTSVHNGPQTMKFTPASYHILGYIDQHYGGMSKS